MNRRALAISLITVLGLSSSWAASDQPTPAPLTLEKPHPQPLSQRERGDKEVSPLPSGEGEPSKTVGEAKSYKVYVWQENGDTLWRIAQKVYGDKDKWPLIYAANRDVIKDPNKIYPKQVLKIPPIDWQP